ncbi:MAG: NUDIX domain-containing protein [Anaerolineales bacterium]|nr:NUDIX domain-containing protein [Anaerolineales bacterium]
MPAAEQGVAISSKRYQLVPRVLCFVYAGDDVLLLLGAPDKMIWAGRYNGLGGHVERGESVQAAAEREIWEEAGLKVTELRLRGVVTVNTGEAAGIGLFVFSAEAESRETVASAEGALEWVPTAEVGRRPCVSDVPVLLARLAGEAPGAPPFSAAYYYDAAEALQIEFYGEKSQTAQSG